MSFTWRYCVINIFSLAECLLKHRVSTWQWHLQKPALHNSWYAFKWACRMRKNIAYTLTGEIFLQLQILKGTRGNDRKIVLGRSTIKCSTVVTSVWYFICVCVCVYICGCVRVCVYMIIIIAVSRSLHMCKYICACVRACVRVCVLSSIDCITA